MCLGAAIVPLTCAIHRPNSRCRGAAPWRHTHTTVAAQGSVTRTVRRDAALGRRRPGVPGPDGPAGVGPVQAPGAAAERRARQARARVRAYGRQAPARVRVRAYGRQAPVRVRVRPYGRPAPAWGRAR